MDLFIQYAIAASQFAVDDARLVDHAGDRPSGSGVFIGSGIGGFATIEREHTALLEGGPRRISPFFIPAAIINLASGQVSIRFGAKGPNFGHLHRLHGVGARGRRRRSRSSARRRRRDDRRRLRGGDLRRWASAGSRRCGRCRRATTIRPRASRPFDKDRDGFVIGEGAGVLVLEELEHARQRGATIYAEWSATACRRDAYHITGAVRGRRRRRAGDASGAGARPASRPTAVDYINAHGTSTPINDRLETLAIKRCSATTPASWRCRRPSR